MAEINLAKKMDLKLLENRLIDPEYRLDYKLVHGMLNTHVRRNGKISTEESFKKGEEKLRNWLMGLYKKGASQDKLTSYLRCGLAHLSLDFIYSNYSKIPEDDLISRAFSSFKIRKFHTTFFRVSKSELKPKKKTIKKKKPAKKVIKKKKPVKKVAEKKIIKKTKAKKPVKKKSSVKAKKSSLSIKKMTKKIIKKVKSGKKPIKKSAPKKSVKKKQIVKKRPVKTAKKTRSMSSKLQSFLKKKKIIKNRPSAYWKDK